MTSKTVAFILSWKDPLSSNGNVYSQGLIAKLEESIADRAMADGHALHVALNPTGVYSTTVETKADLEALTTSELDPGDTVNLLYRNTIGDEGGGVFVTVSGSAASNSLTIDDGIVYENTDGDLSFVRADPSDPSPMWFGAVADGDEANAGTDTQACNDAMLSGRSVNFGHNDRHYVLDSPLPIANKSETRYYASGAKISVVTGYNAFYIFNLSGNNEHVHISGFVLDNANFGSSYVVNRGIGIRVTDSPFTYIYDNTFKNFATHAIVGEEIGGTGAREEGLRVYGNRFEDFPDTSDTRQVAVWLKDNCEYSVIENNTFHDLARAIRMEDGANSSIRNNVIQGCFGTNWTGSAVDTSVALIWVGAESNYGKISIVGNTINHNEFDVVPIIVVGDPLKPQNANRICDNQLVVNGSTNVQEQLMLIDAPNNIIMANSFRANGSNTHSVITLTRCDSCVVTGNYFDRGSSAVNLVDSSLVRIFGNVNGASNHVTADATSSVAFSERKSVGFRIVSNGNEGSPWPFANMTAVRASTGVFEITHNLAADSPNNDEITMTVMPETEDIIPFVDYTTDSTKIIITFKDGAGTLTNTTFRGIMDVPPLIPLKDMHD